MSEVKKEPSFGYKNLIRANREGKVKAFFNLLIPTETVGTIELSGFKVIEGTKGLFISLPNRAQKVMNGTVEETKYFSNLRFESQDKHNEFRNALNNEVLPLISSQLSV